MTIPFHSEFEGIQNSPELAALGQMYDPQTIKTIMQGLWEQTIQPMLPEQMQAESPRQLFYGLVEQSKQLDSDNLDTIVNALIGQMNNNQGIVNIPHVLQSRMPLNPQHHSGNMMQYRKDFPVLQRKVNGKPLIWFDNAATTQKPNVVIEAISNFYQNHNSNIHRAAHQLAAEATEAYEQGREKVRAFIGAEQVEEIIFVRGTTEGINLITNTLGKQILRSGDEVILSELEHHANIVPWQMITRQTGAVIKVIPTDEKGDLILSEYGNLLSSKTRIVSVSHVSNALGTVTPIKQIADMAHRFGAIMIVDGAQGIPHQSVNVQEIGADFYVFSGHKLFGPTGIGAVYGKRTILETLPPWQGGGNMIDRVSFDHTTYNQVPAIFEAGTPNIADVVGMGAAIDYVSKIGMENIHNYEHQLTQYAMELLKTVPNIRLIGTSASKISVLSFVFPHLPTEGVGKKLNEYGIAVRSGHHCAQPILARYGLQATVRPSLAFYNSPEEVDILIEALHQISVHGI